MRHIGIMRRIDGMRGISVALALAIAAVFSVVPIPPGNTMRVIEAEQYAEIAEPMRLVRGAEGASGKGYLEIPAGAGQGWRGKGTGKVTYRFDVPAAGKFVLWARTWWKDGCSNAFFLQCKGHSAVVFGNDAAFQQWHWVCSPVLTLEEGVNYLTFSNHSDAVRLDKLILTDDVLYMPQGLAEDITHFFDGFAGCDADNTGSWRFVSGNWRVVRNLGSETGPTDCLAQFDRQGGTALAGFPVWNNYDIRLKAMVTAPATLSVLFYWIDERNHCRLACEVGETASMLKLETVSEGVSSGLCRAAAVSFSMGVWHDIHIAATGNTIVCGVDSADLLTARSGIDSTGRTGRLGVATSAGGVYVDNVEALFHRTSKR